MTCRVMLESKVKSGSINDLFGFLSDNLQNVRSFKGCLNVTVLFKEDTNCMLFDEEWLSVEDHQNYIGFIDDNGVLSQLISFLEGPPNISYYKKLDM